MYEQTINAGIHVGKNAGTKLTYEMFVLVGLILVYIGRVQEVFGFLIPLRVGLIFQILAIPVMVKLSGKQELRFFNTGVPEINLLVALFGYGLTAALFSHYLRASITFMFSNFFRNLMFFVLVVSVIKTAKDLKKAVWSYILGILILAIPAVFSHSAGRWESLDGSYDPNDLALLFVTTLPFVIRLLPVSRGLLKIVLVLAIPALLVALVATGSRGGFLGLIAVTATLLFRCRMSLFRKAAVVAAIILACYFLLPGSYYERVSTIGHEDYNQTDNFGRVNIWKRSVGLLADNPVFGVGPGCFAIASGFAFASEVGGAAWDMTAHNSFLLITVEMGVVGGGLYLTFLLRNLVSMLRIQKEVDAADRHLWFARALEAAIVGFLVSGFFLSFCYQPVSYFLVALGVAYRNTLSAEDRPAISGWTTVAT